MYVVMSITWDVWIPRLTAHGPFGSRWEAHKWIDNKEDRWRYHISKICRA